MNQYSNKLSKVVLLMITVAGCAGRAANPVMVNQYGDEGRSCEALEKEILFTEEEIKRLMPETDKTGKNVALGVAGAVLIVPWFFMDLSKAEQIEVDAFRRRHNRLIIIAEDKKCGLNRQQIPDFEKPTESTPTS